MAAEAQKLGLDQLAEDLMAGEPIASGCEETWQGTYKSAGEYSPPGGGMELSAQVHIAFTFEVDRQGGVQGTGRGTYTLLKYVVYPVGPGGPSCPGTAEVPDWEVQVSGAKTGQTFDLKLEGTQESTMSVPLCSGEWGSFSMGPITSKTPLTFPITIPAQEGTHSLGRGTSVEIHKVTP